MFCLGSTNFDRDNSACFFALNSEVVQPPANGAEAASSESVLLVCGQAGARVECVSIRRLRS